jgi:hypothetical protein
LFVFWYHSPNILDTPHICNISRLRVNAPTCSVGHLEGAILACAAYVSTNNLEIPNTIKLLLWL